MENTETQTASTAAVVVAPKHPVALGERGVALATLDDLWRFGGIIVKSGLAPKGLQTQEAVVIAVQMGLEVGLTPMAALQNIAVINGRPSIWGDAQLAIVRGTGELEAFEEWYEQNGTRMARNPTTYTDATCAICKVKRRGYPAFETSFSVGDAKAAELWSKVGPWKQYPARMLKFRARSFALRDSFGDALKGLKTPEENLESGAIDVETVPDKPTRQPVVLVGDAPTDAPAANAEETDALPGAEPPKEKSAPDRLMEVVSGAGHTFSTLQKWLVSSGNFEAADSVADYSELPLDLCNRLLRSPKGLIAQLAIVGGAK